MRFIEVSWLLALRASAASAGSCPSTDCWDYEEADQQCTLKVSCVKLTCGATKMTMSVTDGVFADDSATVTGTTEDADGFYNVDCNIGDPGCAITSDGAFIKLTKTLSAGNTDDGTDLGGTTVYTDGKGPRSVVFTCEYASSATASSEVYDVNSEVYDATATVTVSSGDFTDGLTIKYYTDDTYKTEITNPVEIGSKVYPMVTWAVTTTQIGFFIQKCDIINVSDPETDNDPRISIIDGTCYAGVVNAAIYPDRATGIFTHKEAKFSYNSFSFTTDAAEQQKLSCTLQFCTMQDDGTTPVCHVDNTAFTGLKPATNLNECPATAAYLYKL